MNAAPHISPVTRFWQAVQNVVNSQSARKRQVRGEHVNQIHPSGTAGHAIAPRHHQPVRRR